MPVRCYPTLFGFAQLLLLRLVFVALASHDAQAAAAAFVQEPRDVTVHLHQNATFSCVAASQSEATLFVSWSKLETNGHKTRITIANNVVKTWSPYVRLENGSFVILNVTRELAGRYECALPLQGLSRVAELVVIANAEKTLVETRPSGPLVEGTNVTIHCATFGGYPAPQFVWTAVGRPDFINPLSYASSNDRYGWTNASFSRILVANDDGTRLHCAATNPSTNVTSTASVTLAVFYSPRLLERAGTRRVIENSSLSLECNASANPDNITYNWNMPPSNSFCDANASGCSKRFLRIPNVHRSANGTVSCEAFNGIGNTKAKSSWTLNVLYPPKILLADTHTFREHSTMTLTCFNRSEALQSVSAIEEVSWTFGSNSTPIARQPVLSIPATRDAAGLYECLVRFQMTPPDGDGVAVTRTVRKTTLVTVQYTPGRPQIRAEQHPLVVKLGNSLRVTCTLPNTEMGEPAAVIEWTSSHSNFSNTIATGDVLEITYTDFKDEGVYRCSAVNSVGHGPHASTTVKIVGSFFEKRLPARMIKRAKESFLPGFEPLALECSVCTQPVMEIEWLQNGAPIRQTSRRHELLTERENDGDSSCRYRLRSLLRFVGPDRPARHGLQLDDLGTYVCSVLLNGKLIANSSMYLELRHQPVIQTKERYFHAKPNQSTTLECKADGYPSPDVTWYRWNRTVREIEVDFAGQRTTRSRLPLKRVTDDNYGTYVCVARNDEGADNGTLTLRRAGPPGLPYNLRATDISWESVRLEWDSDDDGGAEQFFTVYYAPLDSPLSEKKTNVSSLKFVVITSLLSGKKYSFRVKPHNTYGDGPSSRNLSVRSRELVTPTLIKPVYRENSKTLTINTGSTSGVTNTSFCLRIEYYMSPRLNDAGGWRLISHCLLWRVQQDRVHLDVPSWMLHSGKGSDDLRVSVCVAHRTELCGAPVHVLTAPSVMQVSESAPRWVLYVAASICGTIVVGLGSLLILCCYCRRKHAQRRLAKQHAINKSNGNFVKGDRKRADLVLSTVDDMNDDHLALSQAPLRRLMHAVPGLDLTGCNTYVSVDNTDVHPAQLGIVPHSITPLRHLSDLPLSSADTSDTSVSLLPRDGLQHRYDEVNAQENYVSIASRTNTSLACNHQPPGTLGMVCNCSDVQRMINIAEYDDMCSGRDNSAAESASNAQMNGSVDHQHWPVCHNTSRSTFGADGRVHSFSAQLVATTSTVTSPQSGVPVHSDVYRSSNDQVFEVIV